MICKRDEVARAGAGAGSDSGFFDGRNGTVVPESTSLLHLAFEGTRSVLVTSTRTAPRQEQSLEEHCSAPLLPTISYEQVA